MCIIRLALSHSFGGITNLEDINIIVTYVGAHILQLITRLCHFLDLPLASKHVSRVDASLESAPMLDKRIYHSIIITPHACAGVK